ncbi:hypothetical protein AB0A69_29895 [Streptomyces sp. NPDC045431]|uniref:hypothetical protein n=1 Tax=Streptomyces sp. NPDC045431 TaxID=3155613 RepID=UPI0033FB25BF
MGSLRNPVGPLPSSIYWRRRAVAASLVALLALLIVWVVTSGGDGGGKDGGGDSANGATPAPSITPGPSQPGPAISNQPGGRDESGASGDSGGGTAQGAGDDGKNGDAASGGAAGTGTSAGAGSGGSAGTGSSAGSGSAGSVANQVPADSPLPDCAPGALRLTLRSTKVSYEPGEKPRFELVVRNTSGTTCKADFAPRTAVLTIKNSDADTVWSSKDCPRGAGPLMLRVPAGGSVTHTVEWDRLRSAPQCATPSGARAAGAGTYLVEAAVPGAKVLPASFTLAKD